MGVRSGCAGWMKGQWKEVARELSAEQGSGGLGLDERFPWHGRQVRPRGMLMVDLLRGLDCVRADMGGLPCFHTCRNRAEKNPAAPAAQFNKPLSGQPLGFQRALTEAGEAQRQFACITITHLLCYRSGLHSHLLQ